MKMEQFAIGSFHYIRYPFETFLESALRLGVNKIEIWGVAPHIYADDMSSERITQTARAISSRGLTPVCFCPEQNMYPFDIASSDPILRERSVSFLRRSIQLGAALGAPLFLLCPGHGWLNEPPEIPWAACRRSIEELLPTAEKEGVTMVLETQNKWDTSFMHRARDQRRMLDEIGHERFKAMLDVSQMTQFGDDIQTNVELLGDDIRHMHLTALYSADLDLSLKGDALMKRYPNGRPVSSHMNFNNGNNPIVRYLRQLDKAGYRHAITLEICTRTSYPDPEAHMRDALDLLRKDYFMCE